MRGGRSATYGTERWGAAASSVRRRAPVYAGAGAGVHFTGGVSSAPYYYGRRSVIHNTHLMVLTSSYFHHHYGYHDCGNNTWASRYGTVYDGSTFDRFSCKQATSYRTPDDLDRYELTEAFALPPMASSQWPLELTVHELLLYPPDATEGRAPPALLGFSTNDVSTADSLLKLYWILVLSIVLFCAALAYLGPPLAAAAGCLVNTARRMFGMCAPSLASNSKPGSTMV